METLTTKVMIDIENIESFYIDKKARERLNKYLESSAMSQRKLAEKTCGDVSIAMVNQILSGRASVVSKSKLLIICDVLGINPEELFVNSIRQYT